ncbi:hypothetical protein ACX51_12585 [Lacticaseibacillus paracasei]|uniref:Uncharacterized protein n=1 Tax=Lacticaseibacillus paracasei TaxID=1597 RepID=A0ABD6VY04_LACPA|nr:hypothetical protein [Lacticaseibacillus paracasei]POE40584.1 hypothetical protein ACX51_12585 [Lacticaseibacillus paracasei]
MSQSAVFLPILQYAQPNYKRCECCGRTRDIYYHMNVLDPTNNGQLLIGGFELCEKCALKLGSITSQEVKQEVVLARFDVDEEI